VRHWLANVWSEFDRIQLTDIVGKERSGPRPTVSGAGIGAPPEK